MNTAEVRPESLWAQLSLELESSNASNPVRQLSRLIQGGATLAELGEVFEFSSSFADAGFFQVSAVNPKTGEELVTAQELAEAVGLALEFEQGEFSAISREHFQDGLSYIELGGWIGSQQVAIALMGLGKALGLWDLATPALLGIQGEMAKDLLGQGMFFIIPRSDSLLTSWFEAREEKGGVL